MGKFGNWEDENCFYSRSSDNACFGEMNWKTSFRGELVVAIQHSHSIQFQ